MESGNTRVFFYTIVNCTYAYVLLQKRQLISNCLRDTIYTEVIGCDSDLPSVKSI